LVVSHVSSGNEPIWASTLNPAVFLSGQILLEHLEILTLEGRDVVVVADQRPGDAGLSRGKRPHSLRSTPYRPA
jgi:hypothetical protein